MRGLLAEGSLVDGVSQDAEGEDGEGEAIAAVETVAAGELGDGFVVVFSSRGDVPECWVEDDACRGDCECCVSIF